MATTSVAHAALSARLAGALWGLFIGDALASPAHWVYDLRLMPKLFGPSGITDYVAPPERLPGSILSLSSTRGGGRGGDDGGVVGEVILHDKRRFWARGADYHYHTTLAAGENTLEASLTRLAMRHLAAHGGALATPALLAEYVAFMTTRGSHNDTYAATAHRMFFRNFADGRAPAECADDDKHNVAAIDALTWLTPTVLAGLARAAVAGETGADESAMCALVAPIVDDAMAQLLLNRRVPHIEPYVAAYTRLLADVVLAAERPSRAAARAARALGFNIDAFVQSQARQGGEPMTACYLDSSVPVLLYFIARYGDDDGLASTLLRSTNAGGENVARGAALGAVLGGAVGLHAIEPKWRDGLVAARDIAAEIHALLAALELPEPLASGKGK